MAPIESQPNAETTQRQPAPSESQIRLVFDKFQAFVDEYRPKISLGGVFLESSQPRPVGTRVSCEFQLADGFRLCRAVGEVAWRRPTAGGPGRPAGMGVRFLALDDQGRELILKIVEEHVKGGGDPFEVERRPADAEAKSPPARPADPFSTDPRRSPLPGPREDPASTHSRPAVVLGSSESGAAAVADEFKAPWGHELPDLPEDVIESVLDAEVLATAYEDFDSDLSEAGFAADQDLLDGEASGLEPLGLSEAPNEISFSDEALDENALTPSFDEPSFETPSFETPSFDELGFDEPGFDEQSTGAGAGFEAPAFGPGEAEEPDFDDMDLPLTSEIVEELGLAAADAALDDPSELIGELGPSSSEWSEPLGAFAEAPVSSFGLGEPPSSGPPQWPAKDEGGAWEGGDREEGRAEEREPGLRSVLQRVQITLAESSRRIILILCLLLMVGAAVSFKERLLAWVGLGSPPVQEVSTAPSADPVHRPPPPSEGPGPAAVSQEPSELETAEPSGRAEQIDESPGTTAETTTRSPTPQLRPPPDETEVPKTEPSSSDAIAALAPATRIERITYDQAAEGTLVTVWLDGYLGEGRHEYHELSYALRKEQLVLFGITTPYASTIDVGTLELERIRTGLHEGNRLNLVFDLSSEHMTLAEIRSRGDRLEILVRRR